MPKGGSGAGEAGGTPSEPLLSPLPPQKVMEAMGVLAIVVNCYLIGQCGQLQRLFPWLSPEAAIVSVVVLEVGLVAGWGTQVVVGGCPHACSLLLCCLSTSLCSSSTSSMWPSLTSQAGWLRRWPSWSTSAGRPSRYVGQGPECFTSLLRGDSPPSPLCLTWLGSHLLRRVDVQIVLAIVA